MKCYAGQIECDFDRCYPEYGIINSRYKKYEQEKITPERIAEIKEEIKNSQLGNISVSNYTDNTNLTIFFGDGWANILITYHMYDDEYDDYVNDNNDDYYTYFNEAYMGMGDAPIDFDDGQSVVGKEICCNDFTLVANIFEEWTLTGERYPTTWVNLTTLQQKEKEYREKNPAPVITYVSLYLVGLGENKAKTMVFIKRYFDDANFAQTQKRVGELPLHLISAKESIVLELEEHLLKAGANYMKEEISYDVYRQRCSINMERRISSLTSNFSSHLKGRSS